MINIQRKNTKLKVSEESYKLYFEKIGFKKVTEKTNENISEKIVKNELPKQENAKKAGDK